MKTALTFIHGNSARHLPRFFENFSGICDIMVGVRACGALEPDDSRKLCEQAGCITGEYLNKPGHADWPHVDDYGAARNVALDLAVAAGADWIVWADTDDVIDADSRELLKKAIDVADKDAEAKSVVTFYDVPEDSLTVKRERALRPSSGRWTFPVHECWKFHDDTGKTIIVDGCKFLHAADGDRRSHDERNLRILESIPEAERTLGQRFHLFQSLRAVGRVEESVEVAVALVQEEKIGTPEKYELLMALGQLAGDKPHRPQYFLQAAACDPSRREAFGELALTAAAHGQAKDSVSWATLMRAIRPPKDYEWNGRRRYYEWQGEQLYAMALRVNGRVKEADTVEANWFIGNDGLISLVHATRGRPKQAWETRKLWLERAADGNKVEHIFGLDADDEDAALLTPCRHVVVDGRGGPVAAWNAAARASLGSLIVQLSDDWVPPYGWDKMLLDAIGNRINEPAVIAVSDGHRTDDLLCMAILTRARLIEQEGSMFHPAFFSMFSDNWFSRQAFKDGIVIDARERITFEHRHPAFGIGTWDETYLRSNARHHYDLGREIYEKLCSGKKVRRRNEFGGDRFHKRELCKLIEKHGIRHVIETGTCAADSTLAFREMVPGDVQTIDITDSYLREAIGSDPAEQLANAGVRFRIGNSGELLGEMISDTVAMDADAHGRILYYLDAHAGNNPLVDEIKRIGENDKNPVIVIHDFKTGHLQLGYNTDTIDGKLSELSMELIEPHLGGAYPDGFAYHYNSPEAAEGVMRGIVYIYPAASDEH